MCFAPQRRALFRDLNFQKWSEPGVFCTFWLPNVLRAPTACTFSTSQLPKVLRPWCALYILTWKCASRHNGVHFFDISTAKSGPHLFFLLIFLFSLPLPCSAFHLSILSEVRLLNFLRICGLILLGKAWTLNFSTAFVKGVFPSLGSRISSGKACCNCEPWEQAY